MPPDFDALIDLRRALHAHPCLSGAEAASADMVADWLLAAGVEEIITGIGGHGLAALFTAPEPGPTVLLRAELDALPISESPGRTHASCLPGASHACGHDGHMTILAAVASELTRRRPGRGRVVLLFQPAEETGEGAHRVMHDPQFNRIEPDFAFALHNLPGHPLGQIVTRKGPFAMGSVGLEVHLKGRPAHAASPEDGLSPARALARLIRDLPALASRGSEDLITVVHASLGRPTFGTAPGEAVVMATLRAATEADLANLREAALQEAREAAQEERLALSFEWRDHFPPTVNDETCVDLITTQALSLGLDVATLHQPMRWSEDFGHFLRSTPGALFGLGAGEDHQALHTPSYDFPDDLVRIGASLWLSLLEKTVGLQ